MSKGSSDDRRQNYGGKRSFDDLIFFELFLRFLSFNIIYVNIVTSNEKIINIYINNIQDHSTDLKTYSLFYLFVEDNVVVQKVSCSARFGLQE